ncbi:MAG: hypothetical protein DME59_03965 [Verrucomicrobia bacterium]|nr:MAG: hypothetical protein DME59_03965 [Verrucomicrobiota bacterium]PYL74435.1 MAG: hypothetical protein DMF26_11060 [Verrucomicrobiota bacterium]
MKRILLVLIALAVAAFAGWYYWNFSQKISSASVAALLPRETIFVAQMPDFNGAYDEWQRCEIYQLYREPAVQDFLRKPLGNVPKSDAVSQTLREIEQLAPKNAFIALTSIENNNPKVVGGFRFGGSREEAERIIERWRSALMGQNLKREKVQYQRHEIEVAKAIPFSVATAYNPPWFFAATDVPELEALLDRADRRGTSPENRLDKEDAYRAAISRRPSNSVAFFYLQPKTFSQRLAALRAAVGSTPAPGEGTMLEKMRCITGSMQFENGKIHDVLFLGMPKLEHNTTLTRSSVSLGTKETFLYLTLLLNLGDKMDALNQAAAFAGTKIFQALSDSGITAADWRAAFGIELGSLADWPPSAHWPSLLVTLPVTDTAKAGKIVEALLRGDEEATWTQTQKDGVRYFSKQSMASFVAITPTIALSDRILIAGLNPVSVEEAIKRGGSSSSELADSQTYKSAARLLPTPTNFFAYIDTALLYSRLDASLRPMFLMAAAFVPALAGSIDPAKLPAPEVITKHLSPIVSSQRYDRDGYVAESIGPITLDQLGIGLAILGSFWAPARQIGSSTPPMAASPTPSPSRTP